MSSSNPHILAGVMKMLKHSPWAEAFSQCLEEHLHPICAEFGIDMEELPDILGEIEQANIWGCVFEDFLTRDVKGHGNIVDRYLKQRGWKETAGVKDYLKGLRDSTMSMYEVSDVRPGESFLARDLIRGGEPVLVHERTATRMLRPWQHLAARIVRVRDKTVMGGGVLLFDHETSREVTDLVRGILEKKQKETPEQISAAVNDNGPVSKFLAAFEHGAVRSVAPVFMMAWLANALHERLSPSTLRLVNRDGDEMEFVTLRYRLRSGVTQKQVRAELGKLEELHPASARFWNWLEESPRSASARKGQEDFMYTVEMDDGRTVLGTLELKGRELIVQVNSRRRAERAQGLLADVLSGLVEDPLIECQTIEQLMQEHSSGKTDESAPSIPLEEQRCIVHAYLDNHYRQVLEEPVPSLGNVSPRELVKTPRGQEKVAQWLKMLEHSLPADPGNALAGYDVSWMWEELGISHLRK